MAQEIISSGLIRTFIADGAVTINLPVELTSTGTNTAAVVDNAGDNVIGIALDTVADGAEFSALMLGTATKKMVAAGSISKGDYVGLSGTAGKIGSLTLDGSGTTNQLVIGVALQAADANDVIEVLIRPFIATV